MIIRIVRMTFKEESVPAFLELFDQSKGKIRSFDGCRHLQLLQDVNNKNIYSTYSIWDGEESLNKYRNSELFGKVWPETKKFFAEKPIAQSYEQNQSIAL